LKADRFAAKITAMKMRWLIVVLCLGLGLVFGCQKNPPSASGGATNRLDSPTAAQPKLPIVKLWLGDQEMVTEIASTPRQREIGMMFRKEMAENEGMLFVFAQPYQASFYMRNTVLPLSGAYIDRDGVILEIHDMKPFDETPIEARTDQVQFVLETRQGWFLRHQIGVGAVVRGERGSLMETFFGHQ
jgi:uncharacterized membrane protein (UPF0127 family)